MQTGDGKRGFNKRIIIILAIAIMNWNIIVADTGVVIIIELSWNRWINWLIISIRIVGRDGLVVE